MQLEISLDQFDQTAQFDRSQLPDQINQEASNKIKLDKIDHSAQKDQLPDQIDQDRSNKIHNMGQFDLAQLPNQINQPNPLQAKLNQISQAQINLDQLDEPYQIDLAQQPQDVKQAAWLNLAQNPFASALSIDYGHGRVDIRILKATDSLNEQLNWPSVGQVCTVRRIRINKATGEILSDQSHYYITSLSPEKASASDLLRLCRGHWTIENRSHYVRDVTFREDASQVRSIYLRKNNYYCNQVICALRRLGVTSIKGSLAEINIMHLYFYAPNYVII